MLAIPDPTVNKLLDCLLVQVRTGTKYEVRSRLDCPARPIFFQFRRPRQKSEARKEGSARSSLVVHRTSPSACPPRPRRRVGDTRASATLAPWSASSRTRPCPTTCSTTPRRCRRVRQAAEGEVKEIGAKLQILEGAAGSGAEAREECAERSRKSETLRSRPRDQELRAACLNIELKERCASK